MNLDKLKKIINDENFKKINIKCKFPKMNKNNINIFKIIMQKYDNINQDDIINIFINKNINNCICKCGNFKHAKQNFCSTKCYYFKQYLKQRQEQGCLEKYGVKNVFQNKDIINKITNKRINKTKEEKQKIADKKHQTKLNNIDENGLNSYQRGVKHSKETCLIKYNIDSYSKTQEYKNKMHETYNNKTNEEMNNILEKRKQTCQEKYNVDNVWQSENVKDKIKITNKTRYNVEFYTQTDEYKIKSKNTWNSKTQDELEEIKQKAKLTRIQNGNQYPDGITKEFLDNWDKDRKPTPQDLLDYFHQYYNKNTHLTNIYPLIINNKEDFELQQSRLELKVKDFLDKYNLKYEQHNRRVIKPLELDFYLPEYNLALEVNDILTHNSTLHLFGGQPKELNYHFNKTMLCKKVGVRLIHIFEPILNNEKQWEILQDIILHACGKSKKIYARNTELIVKPAIELKQFFRDNNIQGYRSANTAFVLIDKNSKEPLMCYTIGQAYFGKGKYDAEIVRGACKLGYSVIGGASKLWKFIINYYKDKDLYGNPGSINSIVYYVNLNYYDGKSMNFLNNIKFIKNQRGFWNYWVKDKILKNREPGRHKEIKDLIKKEQVLVIGNSGTQVNVWSRE